MVVLAVHCLVGIEFEVNTNSGVGVEFDLGNDISLKSFDKNHIAKNKS